MLHIVFYWSRVCLFFMFFLVMSRKTLLDLSNMSENDVSAFMEILSSDDEDDDTGDEDGMDFDSDDSVGDPDYIDSDDELFIDNNTLSATEITNAIEISMNVNNITEYELPFSGDRVASNLSTSTEHVPSISTIPAKTVPYNSSSSNFTRSKRQREIELQEEEGGPIGSTCGIFYGVASEIRNDSPEMKSIIWKQKNLQLHVNELVFRGQKDMPEEMKQLKTPKDCFQYFLTDDFIQVLFQPSMIDIPRHFFIIFLSHRLWLTK